MATSRTAGSGSGRGSKAEAGAGGWQKLVPELDEAAGRAMTFGLVALSTDRACEGDVRAFLPEDDAIEVYATRIPMSTVATAETLAALADHVGQAASVIMPWGRLDAIGFGCTSGSVAVGTGHLRETVGRVRPGVPLVNPVDAAAAALAFLGCRRIALLVPYLESPSELIRGYMAKAGLEIAAKASFGLDGDPDMNRVTPASLIAAGKSLVESCACDALFISCTGLRTRRVVEPLEAAIGKPVVTSNQALTWAMLRAAGDQRPLFGRGRLFREMAAATAA